MKVRYLLSYIQNMRYALRLEHIYIRCIFLAADCDVRGYQTLTVEIKYNTPISICSLVDDEKQMNGCGL
jgi:hypothetical protein